MNTDDKIRAEAIATTLKHVIGNIIGPNQTGLLHQDEYLRHSFYNRGSWNSHTYTVMNAQNPQNFSLYDHWSIIKRQTICKCMKAKKYSKIALTFLTVFINLLPDIVLLYTETTNALVWIIQSEFVMFVSTDGREQNQKVKCWEIYLYTVHWHSLHANHFKNTTLLSWHPSNNLNKLFPVMRHIWTITCHWLKEMERDLLWRNASIQFGQEYPTGSIDISKMILHHLKYVKQPWKPIGIIQLQLIIYFHSYLEIMWLQV